MTLRQIIADNRQLTVAEIAPGDTSQCLPEFGRTNDVAKLYGIKRGVLYALHDERKVKSVILRTKGSSKGVRLWHLESIRDYLYQELRAQNPASPTDQKIYGAKPEIL